MVCLRGCHLISSFIDRERVFEFMGTLNSQRAGVLALAFLFAVVSPSVKAAEIAVDSFSPWSDTKTAAQVMMDREGQMYFAGVAAAIIGAHQLDPSARDYFVTSNPDGSSTSNRHLGDLDRLGNDVLGTGLPGLALAAGFWSWGAYYRQSYQVHSGEAQLEAIALTAAGTYLLKEAVPRMRPNRADLFSFPSGHTSTMAASSTVLAEFYGWSAGLPMFALTALTAASRMSVDAHWFSDTVAGAGVGLVVARAVALAHLHSMQAGQDAEGAHHGFMQNLFVIPIVSTESQQLVVMRYF